MNDLNPTASRRPSGDNNRNQLLAVIAIVYAFVAGTLLTGLFVATALHELAPLARVVSLGCYGVAAIGAILHFAVGIGLLRDAAWLSSLIRGTTTAILIPLVAGAAFFVVLPFAFDLNHGFWSVAAAVVAIPWPLYLSFTFKHRQ